MKKKRLSLRVLFAMVVFAPVTLMSAQTPAKPAPTYRVQIHFDYQTPHKTFKTDTTVRIPISQAWVPLTQARRNTVVLGHLIPQGHGVVVLETMVVDMSAPDVIVSSPKIMAQLGETASVETASAQDHFLMRAKITE